MSATKQISGRKIRATFRYCANISLAILIACIAGGISANAFDSRATSGEPIDDLTARALALFPDHLAFQWVGAQLAAQRGAFDLAKPTLKKLTSTDADSFFDPDLAYDKALFRHLAAEPLALCYFREGRFADAARLYAQAARTAPDPAALELKARLAQLRAAR